MPISSATPTSAPPKLRLGTTRLDERADFLHRADVTITPRSRRLAVGEAHSEQRTAQAGVPLNGS